MSLTEKILKGDFHTLKNEFENIIAKKMVNKINKAKKEFEDSLKGVDKDDKENNEE